jgi:hypothetical protein
MPATVNFGGFVEYLQWLKSGQWLGTIVNGLITEAQTSLEGDIPMDSGKTMAALSAIYSAEQTGPMEWSGGIGNLDMVGSPSDKAPEGTIRSFYDWWNEEYHRE